VRFKQSRLKIDWANHRISELESRLAVLPDRVSGVIEINPNIGNEIIKYELEDRTAYSDIALIIGEIAHNLKCSLDYAWAPILTKAIPGIDVEFVKFPVHRTKDGLIAAFKGDEPKILKKLPTVSLDKWRRILDFLIGDIKPYEGGDNAIWTVHYINRQDKHRLLTPTFQYSGVSEGQMENEMGETEPIISWGTHLPFPYYISIPLGWHVKDKGKVAIDVMFQSGDTAEAMEVDNFRVYCFYFTMTIGQLESFYDTL
jgi:hypothetical protein